MKWSAIDVSLHPHVSEAFAPAFRSIRSMRVRVLTRSAWFAWIHATLPTRSPPSPSVRIACVALAKGRPSLPNRPQ